MTTKSKSEIEEQISSTQEQINKVQNDIYEILDDDLDINYASSILSDLDDLENFDTISDRLYDANAFDTEIIYYATAMDFLRQNDCSLQHSLELAQELGFEAGSLNSEILASILATELKKDAFNDERSAIESLCEDLQELKTQLSDLQEELEDLDEELEDLDEEADGEANEETK
jgi:prefoldin subunit 5